MTRNNSTKGAMITAFQNANYVEIMMELLRVTSEHNVKIQDVVLELDFMSSHMTAGHMTAGPTTKGEFKLDTIERYASGDRPAKPAWGNIPLDKMLSDLLKLYHKPAGVMLGIARHTDGSASIFCVPRGPMWSDEALTCFPLDEAENAERLKSLVDWKDPSIVDSYSLQYILLKVHEMAGLGRQHNDDFFMQLQMIHEKNKDNNDKK